MPHFATRPYDGNYAAIARERSRANSSYLFNIFRALRQIHRLVEITKKRYDQQEPPSRIQRMKPLGFGDTSNQNGPN